MKPHGMASETPKKVVDEISKCFMCSSPSAAQERVFIFGNSTHNFVEIIRSSLDFDISCYASSKLFICKAVCYKRLLKFQRATEKVLELKREILDSFQGRPRAKRLYNAGDERQEQSRAAGIQNLPVPSTIRSKASKSLQFSAAEDVCIKSTTCVSSLSNNQGQLTGLTPVTNVAFSPIQRINPLEFRPQFTSTPISSSAPANHHVKVSVQYPSKIVNKKLQGTYENIGKALVHGVPSRIAGAILNCPPVKKHVIEKVMKVVSKEVAGLCSKTNPSLLRKTGKEDLEKYDLEHVCSEWRERAPVFYSFLLTSAANKSSKSATWFGSLALAGSVLLKQRNSGMSATASVIGVLLKSKAVEVEL